MTKRFFKKLIILLLIAFGFHASARADTKSDTGKNMERLVCKYCGREVRSSSGKLTFQGSDTCKPSPGGKHVLLPAAGHCVYCGRKIQTSPSGILTFNRVPTCPASPTKKHGLQD